MAKGFVVVLAAGAVDRSRLSRLVTRLVSEHVDVIEVESSRDSDAVYKAAGVVLVLGDGAATQFERMYGARASMEQGRLLPVAFVPLGDLPDMEGLEPIDLSRWEGEDDPELERLVRIVRSVVTNLRPRNAPGWPKGYAPGAVQDQCHVA